MDRPVVRHGDVLRVTLHRYKSAASDEMTDDQHRALMRLLRIIILTALLAGVILVAGPYL